MFLAAFLVLFTLECGIILSYLSWEIYKRKDILGRPYFLFILFSLALVCLTMGYNNLGFLFPQLGPYPLSQPLLIFTSLIGHVMTTVWFLFCLHYTGRSKYLTRFNISLLMGYTIIGYFAYRAPLFPFYSLLSEYPLFTDIVRIFGFTAIIKCPILFILGVILLIQQYKYVSDSFRHQIVFLVGGACFTTLMVTFYESNLFPGFDPIGLHFGITGIIWAFGMLYYDILAFSPVFRERFFGFVEHGLVALNEKFQILDMNPVAEDILQVSLQDVFGKRLSEVITIPEEYKDALIHPDILKNAPHISIPVGDEIRWFKVSVQHDMDNIGVSGVFLIVISDITQSIILEKQVSETKAELLKEKQRIQHDVFYQEFFKTFQDALLIIHNGIITDCNLEAELFFGKKRDELISTDPTLLSAPDQGESYDVPDKIRYLIARAGTGAKIDFTWMFLSGDNPVHTAVRMNRLYFDEQVIIAMIIRDISKPSPETPDISGEVFILRNSLAYQEYLWNQVSQILTANPEFATMKDEKTLEEIVSMAQENLKQAHYSNLKDF